MRKPGKAWERRAEEDMLYVQGQADAGLAAIGQAMQEAQTRLSEEARRLTRSYRGRADWTEAEARERLAKPMAGAEQDRLAARRAALPEGFGQGAFKERVGGGAHGRRITLEEGLRETLAMETEKVAQVVEDALTGQLRATEAEAYARRMFAIQQQTGRAFAVPDMDALRVDIGTAWAGDSYRDSIGRSRDALAEDLQKILTDGFLAGKEQRKITADMAESFGMSFREAERLVRTETSYVSNQADLAAYRDAGIETCRYDAALDSGTCEACGGLDGKLVPVKEAVVGENYPPMHPWCRCTTVAVVEGTGEAGGPKGQDAEGKNVPLPEGMGVEEWKDWQKAGAPEDVERWLRGHRETQGNILIPRSLGAAGMNYEIALPDGSMVKFKEGTRITNVKIIAGHGRERQIDIVDILVDRYEGTRELWQKAKGIGILDVDEDGRMAEVHWYQERTVGKVEFKLKRQNGGNWYIDED